DAIHDGLADALRSDERVFLLGEDIGHYGGAFGVTAGLFEEFGADRVIDTPIAEEGFVGAAIGAAWQGERPVVELQFADFASCPFDMIVTVAAKTHWRSGLAVPIVIRAPNGGGVRGGPFHASSPEGWFVGVPGLKVVAPGTIEDAYGLLRAAIEDDDPVMFFEHKGLYRRLKGTRPPARSSLPTDVRLELFRLMLLQRTFEERTAALYRQGRISGSLYDGRGQEAVAAAAGLALQDGDVVAPLNRELATHFARGVSVADAFRNFLGRGNGPTFGRDGNMHFGVPARGVFPLVSMLGNLCP